MKKLLILLMMMILLSGASFSAQKHKSKPILQKKPIIILQQKPETIAIHPASTGQWIFECDSGYEMIGYQEHFKNVNNSGLDIDSSSNPSNIILNGRLEYTFPQNYFLGIKTTLPISKIKAREKWWVVGNAPHQTNDLTYGLIMADFYGGYKFPNNIFTYGGLRIYKGDQFRNNFTTAEALAGEATEIIQSFGVLFGIKGENQFDLDSPSWIYGGEIEGFLSLSVNVNNKNTVDPNNPEINISSSSGYSLSSMVKVGYHINKDWNIELQGRSALIHWNGGSSQQGTWPPNDTQTLSILLAVKSYL